MYRYVRFVNEAEIALWCFCGLLGSCVEREWNEAYEAVELG